MSSEAMKLMQMRKLIKKKNTKDEETIEDKGTNKDIEIEEKETHEDIKTENKELTIETSIKSLLNMTMVRHVIRNYRLCE